MKRKIAAGLLAFSLASPAAMAQDMPFGSADDVAFATQLWEVLVAAKMVGPDMIRVFPYEGTDPHGMMLETLYTRATVGSEEGDLIVKRNFGPEGVTADQVLQEPDKHLGAYTVMFRRAGYDPEDKDFFWVKYLPDGTPDKTPEGVPMVGKVAKGMDTGCIACHTGAPGGDLLWTTDHLKY